MRIGDRCLQTILQIQTLTNIIQSADERKLICRPKCPTEEKASNRELSNHMRYGRLILNTEIYPCMKRACVTLDSVRKSRIWHFQIKGAGRKEHMKAYDGETPESKSGPHLWRNRTHLGHVSQSGRTRKQTVSRLETDRMPFRRNKK